MYSALGANVFTPYIEIEVRLGKQTKAGFDPNLGIEMFTKIKSALDAYQKWKDVIEYVQTDTIYDNGVRVSSPSGCTIKKTSVHKSTLPHNIFDIRFALSKETPAQHNLESKAIMVREKHRTRYCHSFFAIDLTHVKNTNTYEIEIEVVDMTYAQSHSPKFIIDSLVDEMKNLVACTNI